MSTVFPISTYYMWDVLELAPDKDQRTQSHIGSRFLPDKDFGSYRIIWEQVREFSPMAGFYAMTDMADPIHKIPWATIQQDLVHSAARWIIMPEDLMFFRLPGQPAVHSQAYGEGPAANWMAEADRAEVARQTAQLNESLDNLNEYMRIQAMLGRLRWPPRDADGNAIAAANAPVYWGTQAIDIPWPLLAAAGGHGGFEQSASTLSGVSGGVAAQQVAWNVIDQATAATNANIIRDFGVIASLMKKRKSIASKDLLAVMSEDVIAHQAWNMNILNWLLGNNRDREFVTEPEILDAVKTAWQWTIETYDAAWEYVSMTELNAEEPTINTVPYLNPGTVMILPNPEFRSTGFLGHCPVPVVTDGNDVLQWRNGRYFWKDFQTKPPFRRELGVGQFAFPLLKNLEYRFVLHSWL